MKIAFYTPAWPPGSTPNGIVTYYGNLIPELCQLGHEVFMIAGYVSGSDGGMPNLSVIETTHKFGRLESVAAKVGDFISPGYWEYKAGAQAIIDGLNCVLNDTAIDVVQMEDSFGWNALVAEVVDIPIIVRLHGPHFLNGIIGANDSHVAKNRKRIKREGLAFNKVLNVTSPSWDVMDETKKYYGVEWPLSKVIPTAVSPISAEQRWTMTDCNRQEILFVGRFDNHKGGDLAIDAFVQLAKHHPDAFLTFVGPDRGVSAEDGRQIDINEYIELKVPDSIRHRISYRGLLAKSEIGMLRRRAYLTIFCSRYENFPNVLLEAVAFGSPLIATDVGGVGEIVRDGFNGLLVAPNADDIAGRIGALLDDPALAQKLSDNAVEDCNERFNPRKAALDTANFFEKVCDFHAQQH